MSKSRYLSRRNWEPRPTIESASGVWETKPQAESAFNFWILFADLDHWHPDDYCDLAWLGSMIENELAADSKAFLRAWQNSR